MERAVSRSLVDRIVRATLYEGYILYPYRPSSAKNRQRFTFGRVYPRAYSEAEGGAEPWRMQTQCLVRCRDAGATRLRATVRFLQPTARDVGRLNETLAASPAVPVFERVRALRVGERMYPSWQEAAERTLPLPAVDLRDAVGQTFYFSFPSARSLEMIRDDRGRVVGGMVRRQKALEGEIRMEVRPVDDEVRRVTLRIENRTPIPEDASERQPSGGAEQEAVILRTLASTHTVLTVDDGAFLSLMDPPAAYAEAAEACENVGTWPVLVGENDGREPDTMLSSPIILYDYPRIAPESPGDFFDGLEIDELLTLRILTMTDDEKREMRGADEAARRLLERTEAMSSEQMRNLHGTFRPSPSGDGGEVPWDFFGDTMRLERVTVEGVAYEAGARVRIHPRGRADIMDLALEGRTARIEAIEQDYEGRIHLALVLEDDPGQDLGRMRQPGHRFFFAPQEVELLGGAA